GRREIGARVQHLAVEPKPIELVSEVVVIVNVLFCGTHIVRFLPQPPSPCLCGRQRSVHRLEQIDEIAGELDGAGHVRFAKIQFWIPKPTEQRRAVSKPNGADNVATRWRQLKTVPQRKFDGSRRNCALDAAEYPAIERCRSPGRDVVRDGRNRKRMIVHGSSYVAVEHASCQWVVGSLFLGSF